MFYCDFKQEHRLRGSFLVYTLVFIKYFSTEYVLSFSRGFLFIFPE